MIPTSDLIDRLSREAVPVRRLRAPGWRLAGWLGLGVVVVALLAVVHGLRPDIADCLASPGFMAAFAGALLTAILAAWASLELGLPDRSRAWALLPLPALALWMGSLGYQCLTDWVTFTPAGARMGEAAVCLALTVLTSAPLWIAMLAMQRHLRHVGSRSAVLSAGLAVAALASAALSLFHGFQASAMLLAWNIGIVVAWVTIGSAMWARGEAWMTRL